jgi:hypothetical protein
MLGRGRPSTGVRMVADRTIPYPSLILDRGIV